MRTALVLLAVMTLLRPGFAQEDLHRPESIVGHWDAWIFSPGGRLPFALELLSGAGGIEAIVRNGPEEIRLPVTRAGPEFRIGFPWYDAHVTFQGRLMPAGVSFLPVEEKLPAGKELQGTWWKMKGRDEAATMTFGARLAEKGTGVAARDAARVAGRWAISFSGSPDPAVAIFAPDGKHGLTGTFLTTTGDYRWLSGDLAGDRLTLSCFDGAHAFLFRAKFRSDGMLAGDFWSGASWHETWTARRDDGAALPDPLAEVEPLAGAALRDLVFPDLDGKPRSLADPAFAGKARILAVFGSWCPNCHDEAAFLAELDRRHRGRGLSIVGLAFELTGIFERDALQVRKFADRHGIGFPLLVAGEADKTKAGARLRLLSRLKAYPTTIFVDRHERVRAVWSGYSGPATGAAHEHLRERFESLVEDLLAGR